MLSMPFNYAVFFHVLKHLEVEAGDSEICVPVDASLLEVVHPLEDADPVGEGVERESAAECFNKCPSRSFFHVFEALDDFFHVHLGGLAKCLGILISTGG